MIITKASGEKHEFSENKLRNSLSRSGASHETIDEVVAQILPRLYDGIPTSEIYHMAFRFLKQYKKGKGTAARYKLKQAIMELGPTGFPFEQFIARMFQKMGYKTNTGQVFEGKCVRHEVDVVAMQGNNRLLVECKFHLQAGIACDVKIPLYIDARFKDIEQSKQTQKEALAFKGWVVTNTHFSKDAIAYGLCSGLNLLGWDFPARKGLRDIVDQYALHPLTCLTSLTRQEKQQLLAKGIVLCSELLVYEDVLQKVVRQKRIEDVKAECLHLSPTATVKQN